MQIDQYKDLAKQILQKFTKLGEDETKRPWYEYLESKAALLRMHKVLSEVLVAEKINPEIFISLLQSRHELAESSCYNKIHMNTQANRLYKELAEGYAEINNLDQKAVASLLFGNEPFVSLNEEIKKKNALKDIHSIFDLIGLMEIIPEEKRIMLLNDISESTIYEFLMNTPLPFAFLQKYSKIFQIIYEFYFNNSNHNFLEHAHTKENLLNLLNNVHEQYHQNILNQMNEEKIKEILQSSNHESQLTEKDLLLWKKCLRSFHGKSDNFLNFFKNKLDLFYFVEQLENYKWLSFIEEKKISNATLISLITDGKATTYSELDACEFTPSSNEIHDHILQIALLQIYIKNRTQQSKNLYGVSLNATRNFIGDYLIHAVKPYTEEEKINAVRAFQGAIVYQGGTKAAFNKLADPENELHQYLSILFQTHLNFGERKKSELLKIVEKVLKISNIDYIKAFDTKKNDNVARRLNT